MGTTGRHRTQRLNFHGLRMVVQNTPRLLMAHSFYTGTDELRPIDHVFQIAGPMARLFAELGGVWNVDGAYSRYVLG